MGQSNLSYIYKTMKDFESKFVKKLNNNKLKSITINNEEQHILFLSIGNPLIRAKVINVMSKNYKRAFQYLQNKLVNMVGKSHIDPQWVKLDIVTNVSKIPFEKIEAKIAKTRKNYFR